MLQRTPLGTSIPAELQAVVTRNAFQNAATHSVPDAGFCSLVTFEVLMLFLSEKLHPQSFPQRDTHIHNVPNVFQVKLTHTSQV